MNLPSIIAYTLIISTIIWVLIGVFDWWPKSMRLDHGFYFIAIASIIGACYLSNKNRLSLQTSFMIIGGYVLLTILSYLC